MESSNLILQIQDLTAQVRCINCSFFLLKFGSFFDDFQKVTTRELGKWFAFILTMAANFGLESFILYHHEHLNSKALSLVEKERLSKRNILFTLISYICKF